jgi:hypothetical protein
MSIINGRTIGAGRREGKTEEKRKKEKINVTSV